MRMYLLASKGESPISKMIRWRQWGYPYTHIAHIGQYYPDIFEDPLVSEAWWDGYEKCRFSKNHTPGTKFSIFSYAVTQTQAEHIESFIDGLVGKKYDYLGIFGFLFYSKKMESSGRVFCSESEFLAAQQAGVSLLRDTSPCEVSPQLFLKSPLLQHDGSYVLKTG